LWHNAILVKSRFVREACQENFMSSEMHQPIADFIANKILKQPKRVIRPDEALISGGLIDSFSLVDLALFVEDTFGVRIADSELNASTFDTIEQLANLIVSRQKK
jgi:acyl carrier protein